MLVTAYWLPEARDSNWLLLPVQMLLGVAVVLIIEGLGFTVTVMVFVNEHGPVVPVTV